MRKTYSLALAAATAIVAVPIAQAANENTPIMTYLGYYSLYQTYGANLANGSNVSVAQDEANGYLTTSDGRFSDKTLTATYTGTLTGDSHATTVGARFFGNDTGFSQRSVAPKLGSAAGGQSVQMYKYSEFTGAYLLNPGSAAPYGAQNNARVASHAYNYSDFSLNFAARMDYLAQRDDYLQVVPNNDYGSMGNEFNSIVIVSNDGAISKTAAINTSGGAATAYTAGRASPTVTAPFTGSPSDAIGQVGGVVGLLISRGKTTNSNVTYTTASTTAVTAPYTGSSFNTFTKAGYTVHSGDTSEVVKAALMAGANRVAAGDGTLGISGISDYRATAANQATNGLDYRWGAGMVNAANSYKIIDAGETDSKEDSSSAGIKGGIGQYGFDYDQGFGGASGTNNTATYGFTAGGSGKFYATLAWNVKIAGGTTSFDSTPTLYDLDLTLTDLTAGTVTALSASTIDNTENIYTNLIAGDKYALMVSTKSSPFNWDYGLAWRSDVALTPTAVPEPAALGVVGVTAAVLLRRRRAN